MLPNEESSTEFISIPFVRLMQENYEEMKKAFYAHATKRDDNLCTQNKRINDSVKYIKQYNNETNIYLRFNNNFPIFYRYVFRIQYW